MARPRNTVPTYRKYVDGRAAVSVYRADGTRIQIILPGSHGSDESKREYERILCQLRVGNGRLPIEKAPTDITIAELVERFMREHVELHYRRPDGTSTGEKHNFVMTFRPLVRLFGSKPATEFSPLDLRTVRDAMLSGSWMTDDEREKRQKTRGRDGTTCRKETNKRIGRVKQLYKWGVEMMLVPASVWHGLQAVRGLQAGRGLGRESREIEPVPLECVELTLEKLPEVFADIARVQLYSGARAGEVLLMRSCDIDQSGEVWVFTPTTHKNAWRGYKRRIVLGPRAQLVLRRYLCPNSPADYLFKPGMGRMRKQANLRECYRVCDYDKGIARACVKAGVLHWSSHQLRHLAAQIAEREVSIEAARAYMGQKSINMTTHYAGIDLKVASEVARRIG
jgi:integrase